jgi:hypothetical protein
MSDWAEDLAAKAKNDHQAERQSDERSNTEERLKSSLGDKFWKDLTAEINGAANRFNAKFGFPAITVATTGAGSLAVSAKLSTKSHKSTQVSYNPSLHTVTWGYMDKTGDFHSYQLELVGDSSMVAAGKGVRKSQQDIAREIIEFIVG